MTLGVWLAECERFPRGYGVAWCDPRSNHAYCLPVPLNRVAGAFRAWWLEWRRPAEDDPIMKAYAKGYADRAARPFGEREFQWALDVLSQRLENRR